MITCHLNTFTRLRSSHDRIKFALSSIPRARSWSRDMILSSLAAGSLIAAAQSPSAAGIQWTDALAAIGTVGATVAAVVGLLLN
jgi:hypothetical protein